MAGVATELGSPQASSSGSGPSKPPTTELGAITQQWGIVPKWSAFIDIYEYAPDLMWPRSVNVYKKMKMNDGQVKGLWSGTVLPISRFRWKIDPNGAKPAIVQKLSKDYSLPILGKEDQFRSGRRRGRFSFYDHVPQALRSLQYGHYFFEIVGAVGDDGLWHLSKLAERPPTTLVDIKVAQNGDLEGILQNVGSGSNLPPIIPADRLLAYVWEKEGGNWVGESILRSCYRDWLIKDRLMRVDAIKHERQGAGTPWIEAPPGATKEQIEALSVLAQTMKVGESAGAAGPAGAKVDLIGAVRGQMPDTVGSMRFHNEEMARAFLMMFMQLGTTETGSRALGSEFIDFFAYAQEGIADFIKNKFNELIEQDVDWNFGEDEAAPLLMYDRSEQEDLPTDQLANLVKSGAIQVDDVLENSIRKKYNMPVRDEPRSTGPPPPDPNAPAETPPAENPPEPPPAQAGRRTARVTAEAPSQLSLPPRQLRRQPYEQEVQASVDYAAMDATFLTKRDSLETQTKMLQRTQINELHDLVIEAKGDLNKLSQIQAQPVAEDVLLKAMQEMADEGVTQAYGEAERQGVASVKRPDLAAVETSLAQRAKAVDELLARSISQAAARKAMSLTGGSLTSAEVATVVKSHLEGLTGTYLKDRLGGSLTQAQNSGRKATFRANNASEIYSSELLDEATCTACTGIDGTQYDSLANAEADYPTGGYSDCLGEDRCRGTLVAVYNETPNVAEES